MNQPRILITGASGLLGYNLSKYFKKQGFSVVGVYNTHNAFEYCTETIKIDLLNSKSMQEKLTDLNYDIIIHCAGFTSVEGCEAKPERARQLNVQVAIDLAKLAVLKGSKFIQISTDHLWDGLEGPIKENQPVNPINVYGRTKADAEHHLMEIDNNILIIRTNFFGQGLSWRKSFSDWIIESIKSKQEITAFDDVLFSPIHLTNLAKGIHKLIELRASGLFNLSSSDYVSKYLFAMNIAKCLGLNESLINRGRLTDQRELVRRPINMALSSAKYEEFSGEKLGSVVENIELLKEQSE